MNGATVLLPSLLTWWWWWYGIVVIVSVAQVVSPCCCCCCWSGSGGGDTVSSSSSWWHGWCCHHHHHHHLIVVVAHPGAHHHYLCYLTMVVARPRASHHCHLTAAVAWPGACHHHHLGSQYHVAAWAPHCCHWATMVGTAWGMLPLLLWHCVIDREEGPGVWWWAQPECCPHCCRCCHTSTNLSEYKLQRLEWLLTWGKNSETRVKKKEKRKRLALYNMYYTVLTNFFPHPQLGVELLMTINNNQWYSIYDKSSWAIVKVKTKW